MRSDPEAAARARAHTPVLTRPRRYEDEHDNRPTPARQVTRARLETPAYRDVGTGPRTKDEARSRSALRPSRFGESREVIVRWGEAVLRLGGRQLGAQRAHSAASRSARSRARCDVDQLPKRMVVGMWRDRPGARSCRQGGIGSWTSFSTRSRASEGHGSAITRLRASPPPVASRGLDRRLSRACRNRLDPREWRSPPRLARLDCPARAWRRSTRNRRGYRVARRRCLDNGVGHRVGSVSVVVISTSCREGFGAPPVRRATGCPGGWSLVEAEQIGGVGHRWRAPGASARRRRIRPSSRSPSR